MKAIDLAAGCVIKIKGRELDPAVAGQLLELRVETTTALPDVCTLRFAEADPSASDGLPTIDDATFELGAALVVQLGAASGGRPGPVFDGEITTVEAEMGARGSGEPVLELIVTGHDNSHKMHRRTTSRTLRQVTVADVARKLAGEHGLRVGTIATLPGGAAEVLHQVGETDWAFLSRLVRQHGGELDVAGGKLHVVDPAKAGSASVTLTWGETLTRYRPRATTVGQVSEVNVFSWDPQKKAEITAKSAPKTSAPTESAAIKKSVGAAKVSVTTAPISTSGDATAQAGAIAGRIGRERVQAQAVASGDPKLLAGEYVEIAGVGKRFGGTHRIVSATHVLGRRGYETRLTLGAGGRPLAESLNGRGGGAGTTNGFSEHLVVAIVTANEDPDKLGRVKVKYPTLGAEVESDWIRVVRGASGKERGVVALPEVNDEVVVGFQHGDVRRPFVLGALYNGKDKPGAELTDKKSSLAARFPRNLDVATKEQTLLAADKGITVTSKQGPIEVSASKTLKLAASVGGSPSALTIETTGQVKVNGKQGVEVSASGPLKITSTAPVTVESNAALQLKGSVIQVQASGVLQLQGATVMLG